MSIVGCRGDVQFSYGALTPVDDFLCACLSLLFHLAWRDLRNPNAAMRLALQQLADGTWPEGAKVLFTAVFTDQLPDIFAAMAKDERLARIYVNNSRECWLRYDDYGLTERYIRLMDSTDPAEKKALSQGLVDDMLKSLCDPDSENGYFKAKLDKFLPFWMWG